MKKLFASVLCMILTLFTVAPNYASAVTVLTDDQIQVVSGACRQTKTALHEVHSYDALSRVNLGQRYENIATRVMAPFISRVNLSGIDAVAITSTTVEYKRQTKLFTTAYSRYESTLSEAIKIDCTKDPIGFYNMVVQAREQRAQVNDAVAGVNNLLKQYKTDFEAIASAHGEAS